MPLSLVGWFSGLSAMTVFSFNWIFGVYIIYKSIKVKAKLLFPLGLIVISIGMIFARATIDFLYFLMIGEIFEFSYYDSILLSFIYPTPTIIFGFYVGSKFLTPEKKNYIISIGLLIGITYALFLLLDPTGNIEIIRSTQELYDCQSIIYIIGSPAFILALVVVITYISFLGIGFLYKSYRTKGIIRKKFLLVSLGFTLYPISIILDGVTYGIYQFFLRLGTLSSSILMYLGLREEPETKIHMKREIKVEGDLFRLYQIKPGEITEEVVTFYKEQEVCLVCKGKVISFNYICPQCRALYCEKCVRSLTNLENACWVCNTPFDNSKPSKPFLEGKFDEEIKISDETQKKK